VSEGARKTLRCVRSRGAKAWSCIASVLLLGQFYWLPPALSGLLQQTAFAQGSSKSADDAMVYYDLGRVPTQMREHFRILGDRLQKPGKERVSLTGSLTTLAGTGSVQVTLENGGKLRIQGAKDITFDATKPHQTALSQADDSLLQALVDDIPDTLMEYISHGLAFQVIGRGFRDGRGGLCDFYDISSPKKTDASLSRLKRYCFDSSTLLLRSVQYLESSAPGARLLETRFEDWRTINGQAVPARVVRLEGGLTVFTVQAQTVAVSARMNDTLFGSN